MLCSYSEVLALGRDPPFSSFPQLREEGLRSQDPNAAVLCEREQVLAIACDEDLNVCPDRVSEDQVVIGIASHRLDGLARLWSCIDCQIG